MTLLAYYMAGVREKEREHMPLIGPAVDRRTLSMVHKLCCDDTVKGMVCFVCAQVHTHVSSWNRMWKPPVFVGDPEQIKEEETEWQQACNIYGNRTQGNIRMVRVRDSLFACLAPRDDSEEALRRADKAQTTCKRNLLRSIFMERFASAVHGTDSPWQNTDMLEADNLEWQ